jgi:quercetin dioxygenase-like cupin family protein
VQELEIVKIKLGIVILLNVLVVLGNALVRDANKILIVELMRGAKMIEKIKPETIDKEWGYEEIGVSTDKYCGKRLHLDKGSRCSLHRHSKDETFYVESGQFYLELEDDNGNICGDILCKEDWVRISPNRWHRFSGLETSVIVEFSTPDTESERDENNLSGKIPNFKEWADKIYVGNQ